MTLSEIEYVRKFPYRTIVGALQYVQVHTGVTTHYAVSLLSRFTNDHGPRHSEYLKQLIYYLNAHAHDRIVFRCSVDVPEHVRSY